MEKSIDNCILKVSVEYNNIIITQISTNKILSRCIKDSLLLYGTWICEIDFPQKIFQRGIDLLQC